jgi:hypothetical protein
MNTPEGGALPLCLWSTQNSPSWELVSKNRKHSGPEGPAFIIPGGDLVCRYLTIWGVQEYWSGEI